MIRTVVFDFDGTLADTKHITVEIYNEIAAAKGFRIVPPEEITAWSKLSLLERFRRAGVPLYRVPGLLAVGLRRFGEMLEQVHLFEGVPKMLNELREMGLTLGILSSNDSGYIRSVLRRHGVEDVFETMLPSSPLFGKDKALKGYRRSGGFAHGELLYVGDEQRDIAACKKARVPIVAAAWGYDHEDLLRSESPEALLRRPEELTAWIRERKEAANKR